MANLRPFPKGVSGNLKGRPRIKPFFDMVERYGRKQMTLRELTQLALEKPTKYLAAAVHGLYKKAINGDVAALKLLMEILDGPLVQEVSGPQGGPIRVEAEIVGDPDGRLKALTQRIRDRIARDREAGLLPPVIDSDTGEPVSDDEPKPETDSSGQL